MNRWLVLFASLACSLVITDSSSAQSQRPNIIIIVGDDMGYADVGFHGCKDIPTPRLDGLAKSGVRFTNGYVTGPYCSPTRAGLMTGRYQQRFGHEFNPGNGPNVGLPLTETTIASRLKEAGYATGLVGKWHLGGSDKHHPQRRGFDEFFGFLGGAHAYFPEKRGGRTILRGNEPADEAEYLTDAFGREAVAFIDRHKAKPFFLYLAFNAVHTPMHATDERLKRFASIADEQRRTYAAMMSAMDENIGRVLDKLRAEKLEENTLIAFISDNGGPTMKGVTINGSINTPLRGSKRTTLEGGIRVPFLLSWKGTLPAGKAFDSPVIQLDLLPTAMAAAGFETKPGAKLDGVNLLPFLTGKATGQPHEMLLWRFGTQMAIRHGDWKLVRYDTAADGMKSGVTKYKLYNLAEDIGESHDLAADKPDKVQELETLWKKWDAELAKPLWGG